MKKPLSVALSVVILFASCAKNYENSSQWIKTSIGGYPYFDFRYTDFFITLTDTTLEAESKDPNMEGVYIKVATRFTGPGTYNVRQFGEGLSSSPRYSAGDGTYPAGGTVTIDDFGYVGGFVIGRYSIPVYSVYPVPVNASGSFLVRRRR
jgi:hypothetical protein